MSTAPAPAPSPAVAPGPFAGLGTTIVHTAAAALVFAAVFLGAAWAYQHLIAPAPAPSPAPVAYDFSGIGRDYVPALGATYGATWDAVADAYEKGGTLSAALAAATPAWDSARTGLFDARLKPALDSIAPPGKEPPASDRPAIVADLRALAKGLRGK